MERAAFILLHESESSWWYRGRAVIVRGVLDQIRRDNLSIIDFGAGYGGMYDTLAAYGTVSAYEPDAESNTVAQEKGYVAVYDSAASALEHRHDVIALFDVLEHIEGDRAFLQNAQSALTEKGRLLITVPAMPFLWSAHDEKHHHFRRYTRRSLQKVLEENGYEVERISYWNMFLFFPAATARLLGRSGESSFNLPRVLDTLFYMLVRLESFLMRLVPLPFGVSLVAIARKK